MVCITSFSLFCSSDPRLLSLNFSNRVVTQDLYNARSEEDVNEALLENGALWTRERLTRNNSGKRWTRMVYTRESGVFGLPLIQRECTQTFKYETTDDKNLKNLKLTSKESKKPHYVSIGLLATLCADSYYVWTLYKK